jgi:hypothetical protein
MTIAAAHVYLVLLDMEPASPSLLPSVGWLVRTVASRRLRFLRNGLAPVQPQLYDRGRERQIALAAVLVGGALRSFAGSWCWQKRQLGHRQCNHQIVERHAAAAAFGPGPGRVACSGSWEQVCYP